MSSFSLDWILNSVRELMTPRRLDATSSIWSSFRFIDVSMMPMLLQFYILLACLCILDTWCVLVTFPPQKNIQASNNQGRSYNTDYKRQEYVRGLEEKRDKIAVLDATMKVNTGTALRNAHENVADVYSSPRRNMYWVQNQ
ncbi:hypothetical protein Ahy_A09g041883 isoform B [Arachis hypogaea]|uniref:Uncharacterized protein n=1 Tax=Arachis hypogaea TaxID=3818 RepID=A0A445BE45_ARAHY|nr:hypothetical protein Ahy_A09g041883 isoform B [Arachis hypogaea]